LALVKTDSTWDRHWWLRSSGQVAVNTADGCYQSEFSSKATWFVFNNWGNERPFSSPRRDFFLWLRIFHRLA